MISAVVICRDCSYYAEIIPGMMQETTIQAVLPAFLETQNQQIKLFKTPLEQIDIL